MRLKALLADDENAVSPVIGVILMVAITVILAAVIASFVLGLGPSSAAPTVNFDSELNNDDLTIEITGGDSVTAGQLSISGDVGTTNASSWDDLSSSSSYPTGNYGAQSELGAGDSVIVQVDDPDDYEVSVVWTSAEGGTSQTLTTFEG